MFSKDERSDFKYWFAHWCAFQMTALVLRSWKFKYLFHDWYKPWMKLLGIPYEKIQKFHRSHANHHLEYDGKKDYIAMMIDWECSRFTKEAAPLNAIQEIVRKGIDLKESPDGKEMLVAIKQLELLEFSGIDPKKYVYLRKDSDGDYYIEYAFSFLEVPFDRCLSWYVIGHKPDYRNKGTWKGMEPDKIYKLQEMTCDGSCSIAHPKKECFTNLSTGECRLHRWNFEDPGKCACYHLVPHDLFPKNYETN